MNPGEISRVIDQYRSRGLFLDANLTVLLVVGALSLQRLARHKRTSAYTPEDFEVLRRFCGLFSRLVTLPNVLTEASDLLREDEEQVILKNLCIDVWEEHTVASRKAAAAREYPYLKLADSAILQEIVGSFLVLSDDGPLVAAIRARNGAALEFDWLRLIGGSATLL